MAKEITDLDTWLFAYTRKKPGVLLGQDGSLQVRNPKNLEEEPKIIPHMYGVDAAIVLNGVARDELRATAEAKLTEIEVAQTTENDRLYAEFSNAESEYLDAVDTWNAERNSENARAVGRAQRRLAEADKAYREVKFKHRDVRSLEGLPRMVIDYRTKDERKMKYNLQLATYHTTNATDRTIVVDKS